MLTFNNDGFDDLAIGLPNEDVGSLEDAGTVNVIYGSASGLSSTVKANQVGARNTPNVDDVAEAKDHFGSAPQLVTLTTMGLMIWQLVYPMKMLALLRMLELSMSSMAPLLDCHLL